MENVEIKNIPKTPTLYFSEGRSEIFAALAKFQSAMSGINRGRTVKVNMKKGGSYSFSYAELGDIIKAQKKPLTSNGLAITQFMDGYDLITVLTHSSGQFIMSGGFDVGITDGDSEQEQGSKITYARRYMRVLITDADASDDDDANIADGNTVEDVSETEEPAPRRGRGRPKKNKDEGEKTEKRGRGRPKKNKDPEPEEEPPFEPDEKDPILQRLAECKDMGEVMTLYRELGDTDKENGNRDLIEKYGDTVRAKADELR